MTELESLGLLNDPLALQQAQAELLARGQKSRVPPNPLGVSDSLGLLGDNRLAQQQALSELLARRDVPPARTSHPGSAPTAPSRMSLVAPSTDDPLEQQRLLVNLLGPGRDKPLDAQQQATLGTFLRGGAEDPEVLGSMGRQRAIGNLGMLTGDRVLSPFGRSQLEQAAQQQQLQHAQREDQVGRTLKLALATREAAEADARLAETNRHNRVEEARPPANVYLPGKDGQYFVMPGRGPVAASGVVDDTGSPVIKPETAKQMSEGEKTKLQELTESARAFEDLGARFKDEYAGDGAAGNARTAVASAFGSWAPEKEQEVVSFWADFARLIDLPERNATFGASLSAGEKASWESAKNIKRGSDPALVRKTFRELGAIARRKVAERAAALKAEGYKEDAVNALTGQADGLSTPTQSAPPSPAPTAQAAPKAAPGANAKPLNSEPFVFAKPASPKPGGVYMFNPKGQAFWVPASAAEKARTKGWKDVP